MEQNLCQKGIKRTQLLNRKAFSATAFATFQLLLSLFIYLFYFFFLGYKLLNGILYIKRFNYPFASNVMFSVEYFDIIKYIKYITYYNIYVFTYMHFYIH